MKPEGQDVVRGDNRLAKDAKGIVKPAQCEKEVSDYCLIDSQSHSLALDKWLTDF